jgi:hypothetical protein
MSNAPFQSLLLDGNLDVPSTNQCVPDPFYTCNPNYTKLTSNLYPVGWQDNMDSTGVLIGGAVLQAMYDELDATSNLVSGVLADVIIPYQNWSVEEMDATSVLISGNLVQVIFPPVSYQNWSVEEMDATSTLVSGSLNIVLILYQNWPVEEMEATSQLIGGSLT